jgi:hypothetical protein
VLLRRKIGNLKDQNWIAIGLDLIVVVVGIFVAIQVDRWYADQRAQTDTNERIVALVEDFAYNREDLAYVIQRQKSVVDAAAHLLQLDRRNPSAEDFDQFYEWLAASAWTATPRLRRGGYDVLISTGKIDLIADKSLQQDLAEFFVVLDELIRFHQGAVNVEKNLFEPYVVENLDYVKMLEYIHPPDKPLGMKQDSLLQETDYFLRVLGTSQFEGVIAAKWHAGRDELTRLETMQSSLSSIEDRLQRLLAAVKD